jgi:hypothetical protein
MKKLPIILFGFFIALSYSFRQEKSGEILFKENCAPCHAPNKPLVGPPFQKIRSDYGLDWTVEFVQHSTSMIKAKDTKALYIYYLYKKMPHNTFPNLIRKDVIKILDYVDTFPYDSVQYQHRKDPSKMKQKFVKDYEEKERQEWKQFRIKKSKVG